MKFEFPSFCYLVKTVFISLLLALVGYFLASRLYTGRVPAIPFFTLGILAGSLLGTLFAGIHIQRKAGERTESIFVGNLAFKMPASALRELFEQYGEVHAVRLMTDRVTRKPRGFGFVEMNRREAKTAIRALNGTEVYGRQIKVNIANERKPAQERKAA